MPYKSRAQQGYMHAAEARGEISPSVVEKFDKATSAKQYSRLPEHVGKHFLGRLVERLFKGGAAGDGVCQHYAHGGVSDRHDPECFDHPDHPMYGGGFPEEEPDSLNEDTAEFEDEEEDQGADLDDDEPPAPGPEPRRRYYAEGGETEPEKKPAAEEHAPGWNVADRINAMLPSWLSGREAVVRKREQLRKLDEQTQENPPPVQRAYGGYAEGGKPKLGSGKRFERLERSLSHKEGIRDPGAVAASIGREKYGAKKFAKLAQHKAQGGQAEDLTQELAGSDWQDERNRPRMSIAERMSGARLSSSALRRLLQKGPGTRVP